MIRPCLWASALILVSVLLSSLAFAQSFSGMVVSIIDGDTLRVDRGGGKKVKVRLFGIDCPEKAQPFGERAKGFTGSRAFRKNVTVLARGKPQFNVLPADVLLPDNRSLNKTLVMEGICWWSPKDAPDAGDLEELQAQAKEMKRGLWSEPNPTPPWEYRSEQGTSAESVDPSRVDSPSNLPIVGNSRERLYYLPHCIGYRDVLRNYQVFFRNETLARRRGYSRAEGCSPGGK